MKLLLGTLMTVFGIAYVVFFGAAALGIVVGENFKARRRNENALENLKEE